MADKNHMHHADVTVHPDVEKKLEQSLPPVARARAGLLPGIAGICMFMLLISMIGAVGAMRGIYPGASRYVVLAICSLNIVGVFGLLRLKRWGWAVVIAGCLMMSLGYVYVSHVLHNPGMIVMAGFTLCFFLYLSRPEVRERLR